MKIKILWIAALTILMSGCFESPLFFSAEVRRTQYGVAHIKANDWGSLGYGYGFAYAQDNFCVLMKEIVMANGQSRRYFGDEGSVAKDFLFELLGTDVQEKFIDVQPLHIQKLMRGYTEGMNRYLADTGVDNLPVGEAGCRNAAWVRPITVVDYAKMLRKMTVQASSTVLADFIFAQKGPANVAVSNAKSALYKPSSLASLFKLQRKAIQAHVATLGLSQPKALGSNAYGLGSQVTSNGRGMLLGNPHFPWQGFGQFHMVHLTMADQYNAMGATLHGFPLVGIGFNEDQAWTQTVSTSPRFVLYELTLNPDNAMQYEYDGELHDITTQEVSIEVQTADAVETQVHTFYFSHFGPIIDLGAISPLLAGWPNAAGTVVALKDINVDNARGVLQWQQMGQAHSVADMKQALASIGIPWANTVAADRSGKAFYGNISSTPHVLDSQRETCIQGLVAPLLTENGLTTLDGSTSECALGTDADAPVAEVFGISSLPELTTTSYVVNSNNSHWLSNADQLLTGFPQNIGAEQTEQSIRTRAAFSQLLARIDGSDGLGGPGVTLDQLKALMFSGRNHAARLTNAALVDLCKAQLDWSAFINSLNTKDDSPVTISPATLKKACSVLAAWDLQHNNKSVGAHIFTEFWRRASDIDELWAIAFNPQQPVTTPKTLNTANDDVAAKIKAAFVRGVQELVDKNIPLTAAWGKLQFEQRNGKRIPIHGGSDAMMFSVITSDLIANEGYSDIRDGNSYIQAVSWNDSQCPDAFALLSYSQSSNPASPWHADQTQLYSKKKWVDMAFCDEDIEEKQIGETLKLKGVVEF